MSRIQTGSVEAGGTRGRPRGGRAGCAPQPRRGHRAAPDLVDVPEALPRVRADTALLERADRPQRRRQRVGAVPQDRPIRIFAGALQGRVELSIADEGPGIPADKREAVFRPFQRLGDQPVLATASASASPSPAGFVEAMDGTLAIEDTPGGGTTVTITLPAVD